MSFEIPSATYAGSRKRKNEGGCLAVKSQALTPFDPFKEARLCIYW